MPQTIFDQINSRGPGVNVDLFVPPQNIYYNSKSYTALEIPLRQFQYRTKEYEGSRTIHMEPAEIRNKLEYKGTWLTDTK